MAYVPHCCFRTDRWTCPCWGKGFTPCACPPEGPMLLKRRPSGVEHRPCCVIRQRAAGSTVNTELSVPLKPHVLVAAINSERGGIHPASYAEKCHGAANRGTQHSAGGVHGPLRDTCSNTFKEMGLGQSPGEGALMADAPQGRATKEHACCN